MQNRLVVKILITLLSLKEVQASIGCEKFTLYAGLYFGKTI